MTFHCLKSYITDPLARLYRKSLYKLNPLPASTYLRKTVTMSVESRYGSGSMEWYWNLAVAASFAVMESWCAHTTVAMTFDTEKVLPTHSMSPIPSPYPSNGFTTCCTQCSTTVNRSKIFLTVYFSFTQHLLNCGRLNKQDSSTFSTLESPLLIWFLSCRPPHGLSHWGCLHHKSRQQLPLLSMWSCGISSIW